jgi:hypothetical protein
MCLSTALFAAQYHFIDSTQVLEVHLSSSNHNRIGMLGDRIKKAFFNSTHISVNVEEETGQLFVQALRPQCPPTTLTVVSASGVVQELELNFSAKASEIVLLEPFSQECCSDTTYYVSVSENGIANFVACFLKGSVPEGYLAVEDPDPSPPTCKGLKFQRISRLVSDQQIVFVYRLENTSKCTKTLKECQVNLLDGDWVFLDRYRLEPEVCALLLIGCVK